jgi:hypothetical protein
VLFYDDLKTLGDDFYSQNALINKLDYDESYMKSSHFRFLVDAQSDVIKRRREMECC